MIKNIIEEIYKDNPKCSGAIKQDIYEKMLKKILPICEGDILEIGAFDGRSTKIFAKIAKEFNRNVYVVDPWNGDQEGNDKVYKDFLANIINCTNIDILRESSQSQIAIDYIAKLKLSFCLIDGLHTKNAVTKDILSVQSSNFKQGIIVVDDVRDLYGCLGSKICQEIMDSVNGNQNNGWQHVLSPANWLGTCLIK